MYHLATFYVPSCRKLSSIAQPYSNTEEWLNATSHALGFIAAFIGLVFLLLRVDGWYPQLVCSVFGVSMMAMFLSSAAYHGVSQPRLKAKLKIIDHSAIYILIAGTYTPLLLLSMGDPLSIAATVLIWLIAALGVGFKCFFHNRFPKLSLATYLLMGWLAIAFIYPLYNALTLQGFWLLLAGGVCYTVGVLFYVAKKVPFTHAIWHLFVGAGCACHYFAIYQNV
ncbi:hemolysin III family protein [Paraglaciecola sp. L3A3]|uniref:PAQR family membrane homeostasis protein TrhA n=1 Tax=Paraglaciecola sp. L3A3 TaxID=2686358 RepID=UPI00131EA616|nr:hemolysin III family protein [Paraglaciecola sp. L3A3]